MTLCILAVAPFIMMVGIALNWVVGTGINKNLVAYSQSAGFAEQALSGLRVVSAFGMENVEIQKYSKYLDLSRKVNIKNFILIGCSIGALLFVIYCSYAWAFFMGSIFIENNVEN